MAPDLPPPSIVDYRPRSTLVTPAHIVTRAKYPAIDFHGHPEGLLESDEGLARLGAAMDSLNVRIMVSADNLRGDQLQRVLAAVRASPRMRDRVRILAGVDLRSVGPGWAERAIADKPCLRIHLGRARTARWPVIEALISYVSTPSKACGSSF